MLSKIVMQGDLADLQQLFTPYLENEHHSVFHFCLKRYYSRRKGIHAYTDANSIRGYYENGDETRSGGLTTAKSWFYLFAKCQGETVRVNLLVLPEPIMLFVELSVILGCLLRFLLDPSGGTALELLFGGGIAVFFLVHQLLEIETLETMLVDLLTQAGGKNE
ncbi:MAG: hypothetical protein IJD01_03125 [Clostridia bacterium]|nr:hypothetical protein [Clostridia bacterium]